MAPILLTGLYKIVERPDEVVAFSITSCHISDLYNALYVGE